MSTDPKLEAYLAALDKALGQIPISDRADIVTEIKSHVLASLESDPESTLAKALASLGEPETVANRYLMERGLKPGKASKTPMVKWLTIGFMGTFGMILLAFMVLLWKFTPILKVDEEKGRIVILGGLIDIDEKNGTLSIGSTRLHHDEDMKLLEGAKPVNGEKGEKILIQFGNGKIETTPSIDEQLHWRCKYSGDLKTGGVYEEKSLIRLDLTPASGVKCEIQLPKAPTEITGSNGKIKLVHTQAALTLKLINGKVELMPHPNAKYRYNAQVNNGIMSGLNSSTDKDAIPIHIQVNNGKISSDD